MGKINFTLVMYILSTSLFSFAIGIFTLVFNIHINLLIDSKIFLSNFLLLGNIAMAIGGALFGKLIDLYEKKSILLIAIFLAAISFMLECFSSNQILLYIVSLCYGLAFSVLMSIHTPFVMENTNEKNQAFVLNLCSSCKLFASTLGIFIGGNIPLKVISRINRSPYQLILLVAGVVYLLAIIPICFIKKEDKNVEQKEFKIENNEKESNAKPSILIFSFVFLILGMLIFFTPYMNLYLNNRYQLGLKKISIIIAFIDICPIVTNVLLAKLYTYIQDRHLIAGCCILCIMFYGLLAIYEQVYLQIGCLLITTMLSSFVFPQISRYILKEYPKENRGQMSGIANMFYNLGDSIGTYSEGIFINYSIFRVPFIITSILYLFLLLFILKIKKTKKN